MDKDRNVSRSDKYQYKLLECAYTHDDMSWMFSESDSIEAILNPWKYDERILKLYDELRKRIWYFVRNVLTEKQSKIFKLTCDGLTQTEIAKELGINQSSVTKCIYGNCQYLDNGDKVFYGGIVKKMQKLIKEDEVSIKLLNEINELREDRYID